MENLKQIIQKPVELPETFNLTGKIKDQIDELSFNSKIEKIKNNIYGGDVFQLVLSERFQSEFEGDLLNLYRALRIINPSPYMYIFEFDKDLSIIGTSPEDLLKVQKRRATILPIAGTRRRGKTEIEDNELEVNLLADEKEIAEHTMLIDLARNDLGRVCKHNSVEVTEMMNVHRFSHVMHIVSRVEGELEDNLNCIDALKASFPAGTVSGAPKIRAIQLINEYEEVGRGPYAGSVGYIDFKGNLDMCIAIRTLFADRKNIYWQAGAGIVADSKAKLELKEIKNKSAVLESALKFAGVIDENFSKFTSNINVKRNDEISLAEIEQMNPDKILISPGPGRPEDSNISLEVIKKVGKTIPVLGVCLGHQGIGICYGAKIINAPVLMHGKTSQVSHDEKTIFKDIPQNFNAGRYHSLIIDRESLNGELEVTSETADGIIMGVRHKNYPIEGIQFHPESILTPQGVNIIKNWIDQ
ncbi:unnamed protein product [Cyprideis torosa]|uniref:Anthranilate synthase component 2 n=1 Tax=Cyprideis torosa TaxID=163714 RepID=A0A7R8ZTL9_9CRUS|nr:unnamed protein product [Cyprideis torosa]CAG0908411.1 unnamed protein product [Cyprideis torosa]